MPHLRTARITLAAASVILGSAMTATGGDNPGPPPPSGPLKWEETYPPGHRFGQAFAIEPATGRLFMFGGALGESAGAYGGITNPRLGDLWAWDGTSWTPLEASGPIPRRDAAAAFNPNTGRMMLFGGVGGDAEYGLSGHSDTWEWDGQRWSQVQLRGPRCSLQTLQSMAFDPARGVMVLNINAYSADPIGSTSTYEWNGGDWVIKSSGTIGKYALPMAFDPIAGRLVAVEQDSVNGANRIIEWTGSQWIPSSDQPGWTGLVHLLPDAVGNQLRAIGSTPAIGASLWKRGIGGWEVDRALPGYLPRPQPESFANWRPIHWDAFNQCPLVVGAISDSKPASHGTCLLGGGAWSRVTPAGPGARIQPGVAFDETRLKTIVFDSLLAPWDVSQLITEKASGVWEFDGTTWRIKQSTPKPSRRFESVPLWYDTVRRRVNAVVAVTPSDPLQRWEWEGFEWTRYSTLNAPASIANWGGAFHAGIGKFVLTSGRRYGGVGSDPASTWLLEGNNWQQRAIPGPPPRDFPLMAYDSDRQRIVFFGGTDSDTPSSVMTRNDTWEFDGNSWTRMNVTPPPLNLGSGGYRTGYASMAYDPQRRVTVMVQQPILPGFLNNPPDGTPTLTAPAAVWEWDGTVWSERRPVSSIRPLVVQTHLAPLSAMYSELNVFARRFVMSPGFTLNHTLAFDPFSRCIAMWGGFNLLNEQPGGPISVTPAILRVLPVNAVLAQPPARLIARAGRRVTIEARVAMEFASFRWTKNGDALSDTNRILGTGTELLAFKSVERTDAGVYRLIATGPEGELLETMDAELVVRSPADSNGNGVVDSADLTVFLGTFGRVDSSCQQRDGWEVQPPWDIEPGCASDLNADGVVDTRDLVRLLGQFGTAASD